MIGFSSKKGSDKTEQWLKKVSKGDMFRALDKFGKEGVQALAAATPVDKAITAGAWTYEIVKDSKSYSIIWGNTHIEDGRPIAILLQYGHATHTGGYVHGRDYINPALKPIFDRIAADVWKAVTSA